MPKIFIIFPIFSLLSPFSLQVRFLILTLFLSSSPICLFFRICSFFSILLLFFPVLIISLFTHFPEFLNVPFLLQMLSSLFYHVFSYFEFLTSVSISPFSRIFSFKLFSQFFSFFPILHHNSPISIIATFFCLFFAIHSYFPIISSNKLFSYFSCISYRICSFSLSFFKFVALFSPISPLFRSSSLPFAYFPPRIFSF